MSEWRVCTVQDLIDDGKLEPPMDGNHGEIHPKVADYTAFGVPFIMASDLLNGKIDYTHCKYISEKTVSTLRKGFAKSGDVLLTHKATIGRTAIVDNGFPFIILTPQVTYYRVLKEINNKYLKYYFDSDFFIDTLTAWANSGSTRLYLGITEQRKLPVVLPDMNTQGTIVEILSSLDDKIDLLVRQNATLEALAQTYFRQWFVEEANEAWKILALIDFGKIVCGKTPSTQITDYYGEDVPFLKIPDMHNSLFVYKTTDYLSVKGANSQVNKNIPVNSICVSCIATVGLVVINAVECQTNQQINSLTPYNSKHLYYLFCFLRNYAEDLEALGSGGTTVGNVNTSLFSGIELNCPDDRSLNKFNDIVTPLFEKIESNTRQTFTLQKLRDTLLPKLVSGNVRVRI
ncbi:MAG: restriction endonuclease subunit S [Synergistaceae bacterium]|nr:restriction endonuclease subunit S [Synergistaceae bacterium]